jgi:hypothetical protein
METNKQKQPKSEPIDIDKCIDPIIMLLSNHLHPDDLSELEQNIMKTFCGPDWKVTWKKNNF